MFFFLLEMLALLSLMRTFVLKVVDLGLCLCLRLYLEKIKNSISSATGDLRIFNTTNTYNIS